MRVYVFLNVVNKCHTWDAEKATRMSQFVHEYLVRFFSQYISGWGEEFCKENKPYKNPFPHNSIINIY